MAKLLTGTRVYGTANVDNVLTVGNVTPVNSTSNTTGSLVVTGGVGITGNLYSGNIVITGITSNGITFADGTRQTTAATGGGSTSAIAFGRVIVAGQPDAIANIANSPLTLVAGSGMTITTVGTSNTITFSSSGGGGASLSGYLANSVIFANSTGYFSNTANLQFISSTNTLKANGSVVLANTSTTNTATIQYNASLNSIDFIFN